MIGQNFPVSDYYRSSIVDAVTISRTGSWWTAVLLINDPQDGKPFVGLYRWQLTDKGWKARKQFKFNSKQEIDSVLSCVKQFAAKME